MNKTLLIAMAGLLGLSTSAQDELPAGYVTVADSPFAIQLNIKPRVDATYDNTNTGNPTRFVPANFPLEGTADGDTDGQFNMNANGSQIRLSVINPENPDFKIYYQNDFFGDDQKAMRYRLQQFYMKNNGITAGYTTGLFENSDIWPDTVDYEGPNAVIYARRALIHYTMDLGEGLTTSVGIENPDYYVDGGTKTARFPDLPINVRYSSDDLGVAQASAILREIGVRDEEGVEDHVWAWGLNVGGNFKVGEKDNIQILGVIGEGVGGMGNDAGFVNSDAGYTTDGELEALPYWSGLLAYTHHWNDVYRSTASFGYVELEPTDGMDPTFYAKTSYGSANVIRQISPNVSTGLEVLYGNKEAQNGEESGDIFRVQLGIMCALF